MGLLQLAKELEPKKQSEKDSEYKGTLANFEPTLDAFWFGLVVLLCSFWVKTDIEGR